MIPMVTRWRGGVARGVVLSSGERAGPRSALGTSASSRAVVVVPVDDHRATDETGRADTSPHSRVACLTRPVVGKRRTHYSGTQPTLGKRTDPRSALEIERDRAGRAGQGESRGSEAARRRGNGTTWSMIDCCVPRCYACCLPLIDPGSTPDTPRTAAP